MLIGIDAACWQHTGGLGRSTRELLKAMLELDSKHQFCFFIDHPPEPEMLRSNVRLVEVKPSRPVTQSVKAGSNRSLKDLWTYTRAVRAHKPDMMFFPTSHSWFPVPFGLPTVVTVHDAIANHYPDLTFHRWKDRLLWGIKMRLARLQARRIITPSHAAREEIVEYLGFDSSRIDVVEWAASRHFKPVLDPALRIEARKRANLPSGVRLILYVGVLSPHKNLKGLLKGFSLSRPMEAMDNIHLAFIGDTDGEGYQDNISELLDLIESDPKLTGRVHFTGFVEDEDLAALYSDALALALPSFSEGFGLPAIEAMACGAPVLASKNGSLPEVVGEAGLYFDPDDCQQIAEAIKMVSREDDTLQALRENALKRSGKFTWARAAETVLGLFEKMLASK